MKNIRPVASQLTATFSDKNNTKAKSSPSLTQIKEIRQEGKHLMPSLSAASASLQTTLSLETPGCGSEVQKMKAAVVAGTSRGQQLSVFHGNRSIKIYRVLDGSKQFI